MKRCDGWVPKIVFLLFLGMFFSACGGGTDSGTPVSVSGGVAAPGGSIFSERSARPALTEVSIRTAASTRSRDIEAARPGITPVGPGVTVNLIQIDSQGNQVGEIIAITVTDSSGNYELLAPPGFTPGSRYVVEAVDSGVRIQSFVTSNTVTVDPYTQTTVALITNQTANTGANIASIGLADIAAVQQTVLESSADVSTASTTATEMANNLRLSVVNNVESNNVVESLTSPGFITGTVADGTGAPLANIQIVVKTFGDQVTQAKTQTDSAGQYTVHLPAGDYIIVALNNTSTSTAASEWWTSGGGTTSQFDAEKVTVGTAAVTRNFSLSPGGRISGAVTAQDTGEALAGINVLLCDFASGQTLMGIRTQPGGAYSFNVLPGAYYILFRNSTLKPYATGSYNSALAGGGFNKTQAEKLTVTAGASISASMALMAGYKTEGTVSDPVSGPVAGMPVRFSDAVTGVGAESLRTDVDGTYRMWLQPGIYNVLSRGQTASSADLTSGNAIQSFAAAVGRITGLVLDAHNNPVSQAKISLYDASGSTPTLNNLGNEISNADGTFTVYTTDPTASVIIASVIDTGKFVGSGVYLNKGDLPGGTVVAAPAAGATTDLGTISLPAGAILSGTITKGGQPAANLMVQVRLGGRGANKRFMTTRTMSDGSYNMSLPAGTTFTRICAFDPGTSCPGTGTGSGTGANYAFFDAVAIGAEGSTTTQDFAY